MPSAVIRAPYRLGSDYGRVVIGSGGKSCEVAEDSRGLLSADLFRVIGAASGLVSSEWT